MQAEVFHRRMSSRLKRFGYRRRIGSHAADLIVDQHLLRFRRAVSHVVNRQRIADDLLLGFGEPMYGPESAANRLIYNPNIPKYPYDPSRAKALLAEIGLKDADGNGFLEYRGKEVRFNILTNVENDIRKGIATIISDDLKRIGRDNLRCISSFRGSPRIGCSRSIVRPKDQHLRASTDVREISSRTGRWTGAKCRCGEGLSR